MILRDYVEPIHHIGSMVRQRASPNELDGGGEVELEPRFWMPILPSTCQDTARDGRALKLYPINPQ